MKEKHGGIYYDINYDFIGGTCHYWVTLNYRTWYCGITGIAGTWRRIRLYSHNCTHYKTYCKKSKEVSPQGLFLFVLREICKVFNEEAVSSIG